MKTPRPESISIIVPTYREAENLPALLERLGRVREDSCPNLEVILSDDDSQDGTEEVVKELALPWVRLLVRTENRGLSPAVLDGMALADHDVLVVMDADLSHPPEKIPEMVEALANGCDFVVGSRYVPGASTDETWGFFRWVNSKGATLMARPFTRINDPMSGFFALRRETYEGADNLNPIGYKIGLELLVKARCRNAGEIPIHFSDRQFGESKLSFAEQMRYLRHLARLLVYKVHEQAARGNSKE